MKKLLIALTLLSLSSCSDKILFTQAIKDQLIREKVSLSKLQYYTQRQFTLARQLSNSDIKITSGKITQVNGKKVNILNFNAQTKCILKKDSIDTMYFAFEEGNSSLKFILDSRMGEYRLAYNSISDEVSYAGEKFVINSRGDIPLLISNSVLNSVKIDKKNVRGLRVK